MCHIRYCPANMPKADLDRLRSRKYMEVLERSRQDIMDAAGYLPDVEQEKIRKTINLAIKRLHGRMADFVVRH